MFFFPLECLKMRTERNSFEGEERETEIVCGGICREDSGKQKALYCEPASKHSIPKNF